MPSRNNNSLIRIRGSTMMRYINSHYINRPTRTHVFEAFYFDSHPRVVFSCHIGITSQHSKHRREEVLKWATQRPKKTVRYGRTNAVRSLVYAGAEPGMSRHFTQSKNTKWSFPPEILRWVFTAELLFVITALQLCRRGISTHWTIKNVTFYFWL